MKIKIKNEQIDGTNSNNVNRGQTIYYLKKGIRIILFYLYSIIKKNNTSTSKTSNQE